MEPEQPIAELDEEEFDAELYMEVLREDPPFKRYVSRGDTPDMIDIPDPHVEADRAIFRAVRFTKADGTPRIQPVLGSAGMGKTHLYWVLKDREEDPATGPYRAVYVPSPPAPVRVPLHFYSCLVDEIGDTIFDEMSNLLLNRYGVLQGRIRKHYDMSNIMNNVLNDYPGIAADPVKVLLVYGIDEDRRSLARRWLLGEALSPEELEQLDVRTYLEDDDITLAAFKLLMEGSDRPVLLFIDEMEGPYNTYGEEGERQYLEVLKRIYNECRNILIVTSCLTEIWDRIYNLADAPTRSRMESAIKLERFARDHIVKFVEESMQLYWDERNIDVPPNPLFPLTEDDITNIYNKSNGIAREAIRQLIARIDDILYGRKTTEVDTSDYVIKLTPSMVIGAIVKGIQMIAEQSSLTLQLQAAQGRSKKESAAILTLSNGSVSKTFAIEVPNVKNWDRSGGVAAFYSARRLQKVIAEGVADLAVIAIPEKTKGAKFESVRDELGDRLKVIRLNAESALRLIEATNSGNVPVEHEAFFHEVITRLTSVGADETLTDESIPPAQE